MIPRSGRTWAVIIFSALIIILVNLSWWFFYQRTEKSFEEQLSRRLSSIAILGGKSISPSLLASLSSDDLIGYELVLNILESIKDADALSEVFIIDHNYRYLASTQSGTDSVYYLASLNGKYIDSALYAGLGTPVVTGGYPAGNILLKSAFLALGNSAGQLSAVLGVEADIDYADDLLTLRRNLYLSGGISVGSGIIFGLFFFFVQRRINASEQALFLSQAQANLGRMVAVVSHEIKNPLMIIRGSAEKLSKAEDSPEARFILEETDRLDRIVTNYLDVARGRYDLKKELVELKMLLKKIFTQFHSRLKVEGINLKYEPLAEIPFVAGDQSALQQVLINLILNAADAVRGREDPQIELALEMSSRVCRVIVSDNGPGIDVAAQKHIFEPFYTTKVSGSGLGLFLSRSLLSEMGGELTLESNKGGPTRFILSLPFTDNEST